MKKHDVIIIGGGPGGSTLATLLAMEGVDVAVFERETYPRFHIGESLLPATMPIFKKTGFYETLNSGKYINKYGAAFVDYRSMDEVYFGFQDGFNPDIPSAFEVERSEFDKDILEHAIKKGATVYQPERVKGVEFHADHAVVTATNGQFQARLVIDATGRDAMLGKQSKTRSVNKDLNNVAVFAHYSGVRRGKAEREGDITIGLMPERAWSWVIPFKGEKTSFGVVCNSEVFKGGADLNQYLEDQIAASPYIKEMMKDSERISEITVISNYSHKSETYAGERWMMIGDAAVFLDPIFSSGVHVSCTSATLAAPIVLKCLRENKTFLQDNMAADYKKELDKGVKRFHNLISLFYHDNFVQGMKKTLTLENTRKAFTSAVAGDMWNDANFVFQREVL
jgi:flavin-dependent dehydrogenase